MANLVLDSIIIYNRLETIYKESVFENLQTPSGQIKEIINKLLDEKAQEYSLKKQNSIYDTKFYFIRTRVKEPSSFYEKLIRKEIGLQLTSSLNIGSAEDGLLESKKGEVIAAINRLDDIIGLRIVTELKSDCTKVYELLRNSSDVFLQNQIKFKDLENQPQVMRNGLGIFRIKGVYQNLYGFELQIKSKIDEAWGDLDHTLFYKDYTVSPIKDTVQATMNNVGGLLDRIEKLLFDLRESGGNYLENAEHLQLQKSLEEELGPLLKAKFGVPYSLKEITIHLSYFKRVLGLGDKKLTDISFDHIGVEPDDKEIKSYVKIRNKSLVLIILESVYINWKELGSGKISNDRIKEELAEFIQLYSVFISEQLGYEDRVQFFNYLEKLIAHNCSPRIFLNIKEHLTTNTIAGRIDGISIDIPEIEEFVTEVKDLLFIQFFEGESKLILEDLVEAGLEVDSILFRIKEVTKDSALESDQLLNQLLTTLLSSVKDLM